MGKKIKVIEAVNQLSLGGTEYALQLYSKYLNKELFEVVVVAIYNGGERVKLIEALGVQVIVLDGDLKRFEEILKSTDVFHWHGNGILDEKIFSLLEKFKPDLVVQTNVFGYFDNSQYYKLIDYDLYVSKMILVRRMQLDKKLLNKFENKRKVLSYPVDIEHLQSLSPTDEEISLFKKENDLTGHFVVGRIGRSDDHKFDLITLDGFAEFAKTKENVKFLLVGSTPKILQHAKKLNILDKMLILETSSDLSVLLLYYKSLDVFLAASNIGESFGMVIAEAMFSGIPVVTISTPEKDNAQIELVDNGVNGFVVPRLKNKIGVALSKLYENSEQRVSFSKIARIKVLEKYAAKNIVLSFEKLVLEHISSKKQEVNRSTLVMDFSESLIEDYKYRCNDLYGTLNVTDRIVLSNQNAKKYFSFSFLKHFLKQKINMIFEKSNVL
jgi:glycosyltransferase involved in cell wall biosynthesis